MTTKIAIFVEGQTELIFLNNLLYYVFADNKVKITTLTIKNKKPIIININDDSTIDLAVSIFNVGNDEKVLSKIIESIGILTDRGVEKIYGLRDLYPQKREEKDKIIDLINKRIAKVNRSSNLDIEIFLAIMEIEAWFLADYDLPKKIDNKLDPAFIKSKLKYDLISNDPETTYDHPAKALDSIYRLINKQYNKHQGQSYAIANNIDYENLINGQKTANKIESFRYFLSKLCH